jgi:hypothetical protein
MDEHKTPIRGRLRRWLYVEWELSVTQVRIAALLLAIVAGAIVYAVVISMLPHHVLRTMLEYEEKSNGIREYFGTKIRSVPEVPNR